MVSVYELDQFNKGQEFENGHYSIKGGHEQRSIWHRAIKKLQKKNPTSVQQGLDNRRKMPKIPRDGKKSR